MILFLIGCAMRTSSPTEIPEWFCGTDALPWSDRTEAESRRRAEAWMLRGRAAEPVDRALDGWIAESAWWKVRFGNESGWLAPDTSCASPYSSC